MPRRGAGGGVGAAIDDACEALGAADAAVGADCSRRQLEKTSPHSKTDGARAHARASPTRTG
jgi:hypothetical protein